MVPNTALNNSDKLPSYPPDDQSPLNRRCALGSISVQDHGQYIQEAQLPQRI